MEVNEDNYKTKSICKQIIKYITVYLSIFAVTLFTSSVIVGFTKVKGTSMEPTLHEGNKLVLYRLSTRYSTPKKEDIVVFNLSKEDNSVKYLLTNRFYDIKKKIDKLTKKMIDSSDSRSLVKRVIAKEGDEVDIHGGYVYINGAREKEGYHAGLTYQREGIKFPYVVPEGTVFVLGDNRQHSMDSRDFGPVGLEYLEGKITYKLPF